jgi:hypothetical protein
MVDWGEFWGNVPASLIWGVVTVIGMLVFRKPISQILVALADKIRRASSVRIGKDGLTVEEFDDPQAAIGANSETRLREELETDDTFRERLQFWIEANVGVISITTFLYGSNHADARDRAVNDLLGN